MQAPNIDRRTAIKVTLAGVSAALLPPIDAALGAAAAPVELPMQSFPAPAMCAELHIADWPASRGIND